MRIHPWAFAPFHRFILVAAIVVTTSPARQFVSVPVAKPIENHLAGTGKQPSQLTKPETRIEPVSGRMQSAHTSVTRRWGKSKNRAMLEDPRTSHVQVTTAG